jgi:hypothetical protein
MFAVFVVGGTIMGSSETTNSRQTKGNNIVPHVQSSAVVLLGKRWKTLKTEKVSRTPAKAVTGKKRAELRNTWSAINIP